MEGREEGDDQNVSSLDLADDIKKRVDEERSRDLEVGKLDINSIFYSKDLKETRKLIDENIRSNDILLIVGAGDIYKVADELMK